LAKTAPDSSHALVRDRRRARLAGSVVARR